MMTTNKLTKTFASGSLAISIAAVAGIVNAPSAHAECRTYSFSDWITAPVLCGDKLFTYKDSSGLPDETKLPDGTDDTVEFVQVNPYEYVLNYDFVPDSFITSFTLEYDVEIINAPGYVFDAVDLDSNVDVMPPPETLTATFTGGTSPVTLTSTSGGSDMAYILGQPTKLTVLNSYSGAGPIDSFENSFRQKTVPEPGTILGLLAVGGLGLVSRFKKQK